ncbi:hypothetical protein [Acinetobacter soli]|uniref:hypothetical protein n=1 Tax=Acinetobacter soli TaxID=487316 RepID=UPI001C0A308A|nr:hypothetical protein [Acinetobacter soli]
MDKCREAFEKAFPVPAHWIEFNEKSNEYYCPYVADAKAFEYQSKWVVWQHQQKRIDELQAKVEAVKQLIGEYKDPAITSDKSFQHGLLLVVDELEQALKGGEE